MEKRQKKIAERFISRYQSEPMVWTRSPGRVDLMGSHTDYNMGFVMTMTIDRDTWIAASPRDDRRVRVHSLDLEGSSEFPLDDLTKDEKVPWTNYVRGIAKYLLEAGYELKGFDGLIHSTVPFSAGLSSSAALEMAVAMMFQVVGGFELDPVEMALIGQKAENHFVGVNSGILDQYTSAMGEEDKTILLDCRELSSSMVSMARDLQVVICDTKSKRNLLGSEYDDRRKECEEGVAIFQRKSSEINSLRDVTPELFDQMRSEMPGVVQKRCKFIIEENRRVLDLAKPLIEKDSERLMELFSESYFGARDLYEIGAPAMEEMYQSMIQAPGVIAARQAGAGFGGCMVALVDPTRINDFSPSVSGEYKKRTGLDAEVYAVQASEGTSRIRF